MRGALLLIFLFIWQALPAQLNTDSLRSVWRNTDLSDSLRLKAINKLAWDGYIFSDPDSAYYYGQLHYDFAKDRGLLKEMAIALNTQGTSFYMIENYAKASQYFYQSLKIKEEINDTLGIATSLINIGMIKDDQGLIEEAIEHYTRAMELVLKMQETSNDPEIEKKLVASYNNLGTIYTDIEPELALDYFIKTINIASKLGLIREQAYAFNNIANIYSERNEKEKALKYYQEALAALIKLGDEGGTVDGLNNIGIHYFEQGSYKKAINYAHQALDKSKKNENKDGASTAAEILYECHKALGNYQKALHFHELQIQARDSLEIELNKREIIRQGLQYSYEKQAAADSIAFAVQQEIQNIKIAEQQAQLNSEQTKRFLLYGVLAMIVILSIVIFRGNRRKIEAAKIIAEQKEEVERQHDKIVEQHKLLEEKNREITDFNNNLETLVAERTKELEESINQIRSYQHDLAHNIRAPYVSLMGLLNLIQDERFDSNENEKVLEQLQVTGDKIGVVLKDISKELAKSEGNDNRKNKS
ncbi:tetratricopeptide repeat protein [Fulvivirga lutimaris]|uniref:tetratricopeptide repeat protein n=1 Tax=Fulvivirga lutimaris TaxID=1819566 RepID=UPI0012BBCD4B|nr:tetratricopeptide repeat protein [Fulvivirga lutimaris]MTI38534.1 tetratricopeptide repeat protein [Fulvivirga lutimaris]